MFVDFVLVVEVYEFVRAVRFDFEVSECGLGDAAEYGTCAVAPLVELRALLEI